MRCLKFCSLMALAASAFAADRAAANLLANPSFEDQITSDGPPYVGFWEGFSGGGGVASAINGTIMPRTGDLNLALTIQSSNDAFAGAFQEIPGLTPGQTLLFTGWHKTPSNPLDVVSEIRFEWRNSVSDTEISRTPNSSPVATSDYSPFSLSAVVPAGADTARVVYAIQTFTNAGSENSGIVYVDDVSALVPEPGSIALLGLAGLGLVVARRRRA